MSRLVRPRGGSDLNPRLLTGQALSEGAPVPDHFSRPEVLEILREYYAGLADDQKVTIKLTGHSAK